MKSASISLILLAILLSSCQPKGTPTVDLPSPTSTVFTQIHASLDTTVYPNAILTHAPQSPSTTPFSPYPPEIHQTLPFGLTIDEYALASPPTPDPLTYLPLHWTPDEMLPKHNPERRDTFPDISYFVDRHFSMAIPFQGQKLVASEVYTGTAAGGGFGVVYISLDDAIIDKIPIGDGSPLTALIGLWVYDQNWVVETAYVVTGYDPGLNQANASATGQIVKNGVMLNEQEGWDEAFGFQTMHGRPFYFFKKDGKINISYDDGVVLVGYDAIPHYQCCSAALLNPRPAKNMLSFFAQKADTWYYVEVGVYNQ